VYLRARHYAPGMGQFLTRDTWEGHKWNYANNNPVNLYDPSGHSAEPPGNILGPQLFSMCFAFHSALKETTPLVTAGVVVNICRAAFNKNNWALMPFNLNTKDLPTSGHDLFGRYLFESYQGKTNWLKFNANEQLTRELAKGTLINDVRTWYYTGGDRGGHTTPPYPGGDTTGAFRYNFGGVEFLGTMMFDTGDAGLQATLPLEFVLGSFNFQVLRVGDRLGFRIDNDMTLESGTHISGRKPEDFSGSLEDLIGKNPHLANEPFSKVINMDYQGKPIISILSSQFAENTTGNNGGGSLYQTFTWTERYDPCLANLLPQQLVLSLFDIQVWSNYDLVTKHPGDPFP